MHFADDTTIYACGQNLDSVAANIESDMKAAISWHENNEMVPDSEKFQLMVKGLKIK